MRPRVVLSAIAKLIAFSGATMLLPAAVAALYSEPAAAGIAVAGALSVGFGWSAGRAAGQVEEIGIRDAFAIVTLGWIAVCLFGTLPYLLTGTIPSFSHAFFETMSGFTTTGATIVSDLDVVPRGVLLWRSQTQWMGGMGIIVLTVAILPLLGVGGMQLLQAEIPGLAADRLRPRVRQTATVLWGVYALLTAVQAILLSFAGMDPFESVNHAFTTLATGGFSTHDASIAGFQSPLIEWIIALFVILAGVNFTLHYSWLGGRWGTVWGNQELRVYLGLIAASAVGLTLIVWLPGQIPVLGDAFRAGLFQAASLMTTTGFVSANYELWAPPGQVILILLMLVGGCTGSTSGSIKVLRHMLVAAEGRTAMRRLLHPQAIFVYKIDGRPLSTDVLASVSGFLLVYLLALVAGVFALTILGIDVRTAIGAATATIGNVGPGLGAVGPVAHYGELPVSALWVLAFLMLIGRLELYTVLVLFTRGYWR